jgi:hypothetical protein
MVPAAQPPGPGRPSPHAPPSQLPPSGCPVPLDDGGTVDTSVLVVTDVVDVG